MWTNLHSLHSWVYLHHSSPLLHSSIFSNFSAQSFMLPDPIKSVNYSNVNLNFKIQANLHSGMGCIAPPRISSSIHSANTGTGASDATDPFIIILIILDPLNCCIYEGEASYEFKLFIRTEWKDPLDVNSSIFLFSQPVHVPLRNWSRLLWPGSSDLCLDMWNI